MPKNAQISVLRILVFLLVILSEVCSQVPQSSVSDKWVMRLSEELPSPVRDSILSSLEGKRHHLKHRQELIELESKAVSELPAGNWDALLGQTHRWSRWVEVEPNHPFSIENLPDDSLLAQQFALGNLPQSESPLGLHSAWQLYSGDKNFVAGVIDTGIDFQHEDLAENIWQNLAEDADGDGHTLEWINGKWEMDPGDLNGIDDDQNGYPDDLIGWDFINDDNNPMDAHGHGTHVAGILGARGNNQRGIAGVNWNIGMMALKAFDEQGRSSLSIILEAMAYARNQGARLVNNSWGGINYSQFLYDEISDCHEEGMLVVAAAGNSGMNLINQEVYPASYDLPNIISVGALDSDNKLASFSNYGVNHVDLLAPGVSILSTVPNNRYKRKSGTSMSTPFVSGVLSLVWSYASGMGHMDIKDLILSTVNYQQELSQVCKTGGSLYAFGALRHATDLCVDWVVGTRGHHIKSLADDGLHIWAATDKGLLKLKKNDCGFTHYTKDNSSLEDDKILTVEVGTDNSVWIGTEKKGLLRINNGVWTSYTKNNSPLPDNKISALFSSDDGNIWVGTDKKGFCFFDGTNWTVYDKKNSPLPSDQVRSMFEDDQGTIWLGTSKGLVKFQQGSWTVIDKDNSPLPDDKVNVISIDEDGDVWIGTEKGLAEWRSNGWTVFDKNNSILPDDKLQSITIQKDSVKWFGTHKGLVSFDGLTWTLFDKDSDVLPNESVNSLETDAYNNTWAGTDDGIQLFSNQVTARFSRPDSVCMGYGVSFQNQSQGADSYSWKINGLEVSQSENLAYQFNAPGTYLVSLTARNQYSSRSTEMNVYVSPSPAVNLGRDTSICASRIVLDASTDDFAVSWWNLQGQLLGEERTLSVDQSGTYIVEVSDGCGQAATDSLNLSLNPGCVWPGDVNADGRVNMIDHLCLGLIDGATGPSRGDTSTQWTPVQALDWNQSFPAGHQLAPNVNFKHADANGDGVIDLESDGRIILQNLIYSHKAENQFSGEGSYIKIVPTHTTFIGQDSVKLDFDISLQHSSGGVVPPVHGIAFSLEFSHALAKDPLITIDTTWLGSGTSISKHEEGSQEQNALNQIFSEGRKTDLSFSRRKSTNLEGETFVFAASIIVTIDDLANGDSTALSYNVFDVQARRTVLVDSAGKKLPTIEWENNEVSSLDEEREENDSMDQEPFTADINEGLRVYPIPASQGLHVDWAKEEHAVEFIRLLSMDGKELYTKAVRPNVNKVYLPVHFLRSGIYYLELKQGETRIFRKIAISR